MSDGINVMPQGEVRAGVVVTKEKLIVQLKNIFRRIKRARRVLMHREMRHGLVGKEVWRAI